jgi:hypothetical protein
VNDKTHVSVSFKQVFLTPEKALNKPESELLFGNELTQELFAAARISSMIEPAASLA